MPTINCDRTEFFKRLGKEFCRSELSSTVLMHLRRRADHQFIEPAFHDFDELLFEYGLELDEDTTMDPNHPKGEPHQLKIEVPANRYDLLCFEGIVRALKLYLNPEQGAPSYTLKMAPEGQERTVRVSPETTKIRPFFASAILRNVSFDKISYASFIDLQDKLHANLARKRTLVAIGTHDLDKIVPGDITYEALPPKDINFIPLNKTQSYNAVDLMTLFKEDKHLSKYLHIIEDSPVYPIIYAKDRQVLSMPPIINSEGTKISVDTKNVFIDVTATDETKLGYVIDIIVTMFSEYCAEPFTVEPVKIVFPKETPGGARTILSPALAARPFVARTSYINSCTGLDLKRAQIVELLRQMGHNAFIPQTTRQPFAALNDQKNLTIAEEDLIHILVPPTRPDILHECDIMEDAAVAYGFNKLLKTFPRTSTVAKPFPPNKLSDSMRRLCSEAGWTEVLPLTLCSHDENFKFLNRKDPGTMAVVLANPKTVEYQIVRTSLLPGMLKTIRENRKHALPLRIFEVGDIVLKDSSVERMARNVRRVGAIFCGRKAGFEIVHGLLDRLMLGLGIRNIENEKNKAETGYYIKGCDDATYFPDRSAKIFFRPPLVAGAHTTFAPTESANSGHAAASQQDSSTAAQGPPPTSTLDNIKEKLSAALPTTTSKSATPPIASRDIEIGSLGILHPSVLKAYELDYPCSSIEFDIEPFL